MGVRRLSAVVAGPMASRTRKSSRLGSSTFVGSYFTAFRMPADARGIQAGQETLPATWMLG
jgi:hypothetical protein